MTKPLLAMLVGAHFRPPAAKLLMHLPSGAKLTLAPELDNSYDEDAIKVLVASTEIPEQQLELLEQNLEGTGYELMDILAEPSWHLGYIARSGAKTAGGLPGNKELKGATEGKLRFSPEGKPQVEVSMNAGLQETRVGDE